MFSLRRNKYFIFLFIIIILFAINNFIWLKNNKLPPIGNALQDLFPGINFYLDTINNNITFKKLVGDLFRAFLPSEVSAPFYKNYFRFQFYIYPPLVPLSFSLFYFLFGTNTGLELMVNLIYFAIAMASIYGIGKRIFNENFGFLAAFIFSSFPGIISLSRAVYAEFNLMCMIATTLFFLLKTDFFKSRKYSVIFGISLGLTALTKWEFLITMSGPFLWYLSQSHLFAIGKRKIAVSNSYIRINFLLPILLSISMSFFWYSVSLQDIFWRLFLGPGKIQSEKLSSLPFGVLLQKFSYFPLAIINSFISFFYFLLLILAGVSFIYRIIKNRHRLSEIKSKLFYVLFLVLWIIIPCLLLPLTLHVSSHIMPILPAIAIVISLGIFSLKNIIVRSIFISLTILFGLGSYLHSFVDFGKFDLLYKLKLYLGPDLNFSLTTKTDNTPRDAWQERLFSLPDTRDWKMKEILSFIKEDSCNIKSHPTIFILSTREKYNCFGFQYYNLLGDYQLFIEPRGNDRSSPPPDPSKFDYVVVNPLFNNRMDETVLSETIKLTPNIEKVHKIDELKKTFFNKYKLIKEYVLPNNTKAKIYKLTNS